MTKSHIVLMLVAIAAFHSVPQVLLGMPESPEASSSAIRGDGQIAIFELPFLIDEPGHYFLSRDVTGVAGENGVIIDSDDVTLDLNGFSLLGTPGSLAGVSVTQFSRNIRIRNGGVRDWGDAGIEASVNNGEFQDLQIWQNGGHGLVTGTNCILRDVQSFGNGGYGFLVGVGSVADGIVARGNQRAGILADTATRIEDSTSVRNLGPGIDASGGASITGCTVRGNFGPGIVAGDDVLVLANNVTDGTVGIRVDGTRSRIEGNHVSDQFTAGIEVLVGGNLIVKNSVTMSGTGFAIAPGNTVGTLVTGPTPGIKANAWANFEF